MKNLSKIIGASVLVFSLIVNVDARFNQQNLQDDLLNDLKGLAPAGDQSAYAGNLSGAAVRSLLAKSPACDQQDVADNFVDLANIIGEDGDAETKTKMIDLTKTFRTAERNTPNDGQPSANCDREPRNPELKDIKQKQDPSPNPKGLAPFVADPTVSSDIPTFVVGGKTLIPAGSSQSEEPKKSEDEEIKSLLKKIDNKKLSSKDKKMVKTCKKSKKSRDKKKCIDQLTKLAKKFPKE